MSGRASGCKKFCSRTPMKVRQGKIMPARTSPGQTRSAFPSLYPGGNDKLARSTGPGLKVKVSSVNVGTMRGREGEVVRWWVGGNLNSVVGRRRGGGK